MPSISDTDEFSLLKNISKDLFTMLPQEQILTPSYWIRAGKALNELDYKHSKGLGSMLIRLGILISELKREVSQKEFASGDQLAEELYRQNPQKAQEFVGTFYQIGKNLYDISYSEARALSHTFTSISSSLSEIVEKDAKTHEKAVVQYQWNEGIKILQQPDIADKIHQSLSAVIVGNKSVLRNLVFDMALVGTPKIELGTGEAPLRSFRSHPSIWLVGSAESGKGQILKLVNKISPNSFWVSHLTRGALKFGLATAINNGCLIIPEGDAIYFESPSGGHSMSHDPTIVQIRQVIEDNLLVYYYYNPLVGKTDKIEIDTHTSVFIGSTQQPTEPQIATRFSFYKLEKNPYHDLHVMLQEIEGISRKMSAPPYYPQQLSYLYSIIYFEAVKSNGVIFSSDIQDDLKGMAYYLASHSINRADIPDEFSRTYLANLVAENYKSEIDQRNIKDILYDYSQTNHGYSISLRRYEDVIRRIMASAYLHMFQRPTVDGYIPITKQDVGVGWDFLLGR